MKQCKKCGAAIPASVKINGKRKVLCSRKLCLKCSPFRGDNYKKLICKKCGSKFSARQNGVGLYSRAYCLECVPFGTRLQPTPQNRTCTICGKVYEYIRSKNKKYKDKGHKAKRCNSCVTVDRHIARKKRAVAYKGYKCVCCGYDRYYGAMDFHHQDPNEKDFEIGGNWSKNWETIRRELDKCILICSNCHRELHDRIRKEQRNESIHSGCG